MAKWIASFREGDEPWGEEIRIRIEGTEIGFMGIAENGEDLDLTPADTEEEAVEEIEYAFAGYESFRWLEED